MSRLAMFVYGLVCYILFLLTFLYAIGFIGNIIVPKKIDEGTVGPLVESIIVNVLLLSLFAIQHSIMARPWFKDKWTRVVPKPIERSTYVLLTNVVLTLLYWQWRPMPTIVWEVENEIGRSILAGVFFGGWAIVLYSTFLIDHFDLFGLRQVFLHLRGQEHVHKTFRTPSLYRFVRHPLMLGFIIAFWATPVMSQGHLLFAVVTTAYILIAIQLEERDLVELLGDDYRQYQKQVPMILPFPKGKAS